MDRALSTHLFVNEPLTAALLRRLEQAGIREIEIFCARQHFDYRDAGQVRELAAWLGDHELTIRSLHAPLFSDRVWGRSDDRAKVNIASLDRALRIASVDEVKRALDLADTVAFRYLVQHMGVPGEEYSQRKFDAAYTSFESLSLFARQRGVTVLLENIPNDLSTPARLRQFLDYTRLGDLRVCFDTGHAHLAGGVEEDFDGLHSLVESVHIHDNHGEKDEHLFPFEGGIDWERAMQTLAGAKNEFPLQLELRDHGEHPDPLAKALETFDRLEQLIPAGAATGRD